MKKLIALLLALVMCAAIMTACTTPDDNNNDDDNKLTNFPTLSYLYNTSDSHKAIGEYLQSALANFGITMNLENQEWNTFLNTRKNGDYSIARNGWVASICYCG